MIVELTPENYFDNVNVEGPLHVVMHYGANCGPCKVTFPNYELLYLHFQEHKVTNVRFYKFHQWEDTYQEFITQNNLKPSGVPCFKYHYMNEVVDEHVGAYHDPNLLKKRLLDVCDAIHLTMGGFDLFKTY